jgi:hypothetical protein
VLSELRSNLKTGRTFERIRTMSKFFEAIAKMEGKFVEVGTQGEWTDKGQVHSVSPDHVVLLQPNSDRLIIVKMDALEYVKEIPAPGSARVTGRIAK